MKIIVKSSEVKDIIENLVKVKTYITIEYPYFYPILKNLGFKVIKFHEDLKDKVYALPGDKYVVINLDWWRRFDLKDKVFIILHEAMHIVLKHLSLGRLKKFKGTWNMSCDCLVNEFLKCYGVKPGKELSKIDIIYADYLAKITNIDVNTLIKMSADEIYYLLLKRGVMIEDTYELSQELITKIEGYEADGEITSNSEANPSALREVENFARSIGKLPGNAEIIINSLLKPKINWRRILRVSLSETFNPKVVRTWRRIDRKLPNNFPGYEVWRKSLSAKNIWILLDISGSITSEPEILKQFFTEVFDIAKHFKANIHLITWDTTVRDVLQVKSIKDILNRSFKGGGGTIIDDALKYYIEHAVHGRENALIILTDGELIINDTELSKRALELSKIAIYCYTINQHSAFKKYLQVRIL